ncbi:MAG: KH domain-containing protein [Myxococcales bacterium]|nr:KH domain-containing protein [Myxococcales bacterium]
MRELVAFLAKALVDDPDAVEVKVVEEDRAYVFELSVAQGDLGKVIGKEGRTARAIRTLLATMATRSRKRAILDILE